jgi:hypothetical protein
LADVRLVTADLLLRASPETGDYEGRCPLPYG